MLITEFQSSVVTWGITAVVAAAAVIAGIFLIRSDSSAGLPVIIVGLLLAFLAGELSHGTRLLVVVPGDGRPERRDLRLYGSKEYRFADGSSEQIRWKSAKQLVLNDTPVPLTVEKRLYGTTFAEPDERRVEPYGSAKLDGMIDHFGPEDLPPGTSEKWERYWIRW